MTRLLSPNMADTGNFNIQLAVELGSLELAVIIQFFINTIAAHKRLGRNLKNGFTWNYCSKKELCAYFPYWTEKMIRTRLTKLIKMKVLKTNNFNKCKWDQTIWYAFEDESKWGLSKISNVGPKGPPEQTGSSDGADQDVKPIPQTLPLTQPSVCSVNDTSLTPSKDKSKSLVPSKRFKLSDAQSDSFNWLRGLAGLEDTEDKTLTWWAKTYSVTRLDEVYREATNKPRRSVGAYMRTILEKGSVVTTGRVGQNKEYAEMFKDLKKWASLKIFQKYGTITHGNAAIEIDFNQDHENFVRDLEEKYIAYG